MPTPVPSAAWYLTSEPLCSGTSSPRLPSRVLKHLTRDDARLLAITRGECRPANDDDERDVDSTRIIVRPDTWMDLALEPDPFE